MKKKIAVLITICIGIMTFSGCDLANKNENKAEKGASVEENVPKENMQTVAANIMNNYYANVYHKHSQLYCGKLDYNDTYIDNNTYNYVFSKEYNSISDVKNHFKIFLSEKFINENLIEYFIEKDSKVYCKTLGRGSLPSYDKSSINVIIKNQTSEKLEVETTIKTVSDEMYESTIIKSKSIIIKENNNWVLDQYEEEI